MKQLIMCEGPNELKLIDILLDANKLVFSRDDLLDRMAFHARQLHKSARVMSALGMYPGEVNVLRVGDTLNDQLKVSSAMRPQIASIAKYCTKPELEMLLIIAENKVHEYERSGLKPKEYAKQNIRIGKCKYDNSTAFWDEYFGNNPDLLVSAIQEYKRIKRHGNDELFLADLLR